MPPPDGMAGGEKLMAYLRNIAGNLQAAGDNPEVRIGFLESATYPDGKPVAMIAAIQEWGTDRIPPRPFFRNMIKAKAGAWGGELGKVMVSAGFDSAKTLTSMGMLIQGQLFQSIVDTNSPALAPSTIARKSKGKVTRVAGAMGPEKPLVDTRVMLKSVDYEVST